MEKVTKIAAILVLIVSIGFLFFAAKSINRIELQKGLITSLQDNVSSLQNTIDSLTKTINLAKDEIGSLRILAEQLREETANAIADKEKAERDLAEVTNENRRLNTELQQARAKIVILTDELAKYSEEGVDDIILDGTDLESMVSQLSRKLKETENKLSIAQDQLATLEALGILMERESSVAGEGTPQVVKEIEGKVVDIKQNGVIAINFKGSIKPQKGTTFYIIDSDQVKAKLSLGDVYNTIMVAQMDIEKHDYNIKSGDNVKLVLWVEE